MLRTLGTCWENDSHSAQCRAISRSLPGWYCDPLAYIESIAHPFCALSSPRPIVSLGLGVSQLGDGQNQVHTTSITSLEAAKPPHPLVSFVAADGNTLSSLSASLLHRDLVK